MESFPSPKRNVTRARCLRQICVLWAIELFGQSFQEAQAIVFIFLSLALLVRFRCAIETESANKLRIFSLSAGNETDADVLLLFILGKISTQKRCLLLKLLTR